MGMFCLSEQVVFIYLAKVDKICPSTWEPTFRVTQEIYKECKSWAFLILLKKYWGCNFFLPLIWLQRVESFLEFICENFHQPICRMAAMDSGLLGISASSLYSPCPEWLPIHGPGIQFSFHDNLYLYTVRKQII